MLRAGSLKLDFDVNGARPAPSRSRPTASGRSSTGPPARDVAGRPARSCPRRCDVPALAVDSSRYHVAGDLRPRDPVRGGRRRRAHGRADLVQPPARHDERRAAARRRRSTRSTSPTRDMARVIDADTCGAGSRATRTSGVYYRTRTLPDGDVVEAAAARPRGRRPGLVPRRRRDASTPRSARHDTGRAAYAAVDGGSTRQGAA